MEKMPTAGIILAAGSSSRLGRPKQLLDIGGRPLVVRTVQTALSSLLERVVLVLGHEAEAILASLGPLGSEPRLVVRVNSRYGEGMSTTLREGLEQVADFPSVMVILADHPFLDYRLMDLLLTRFRSSDKDICVPCCKGRQGSPTIFGARFYPDIMKIRGDAGGREIIRKNPESLLRVEIETEDSFFDIDTEEDLVHLGLTPR
ncbi:MAG: nucleotidyltransferase family protein [Syntrophobacteraceae bacterium]|nr:nucleotidyltransferase family protein [Syntrophobacteraceae bacterium]